MLTKHHPIVITLPTDDRHRRLPPVDQRAQLRLPVILKSERAKERFVETFITHFDQVSNYFDRQLEENKVTEAITFLMDKIYTLASQHSSKKQKKSGPAWFNHICRLHKKEGRAALQIFRKNRELCYLNKFKEAKRDYRKAIREAKKKYSERMREKIARAVQDNETNLVWGVLKSTKKKRSIEIQISANQWIEYFNETLNYNVQDRPEWNVIEDDPPDVDDLDRPISDQEIISAVKKVKKGKAAGRDGVTGDLLKLLLHVLTPSLNKLFNKIFETGNFPKDWTSAILCPIYKGVGNRNVPSNYRGIALLAHVGKLFTRILKARIEEWVDRHNLISQNQGGFRKGRRTVDNAMIIDTFMREALSIKSAKLYIATVDLRRAFDYVPRKAVLYRLAEKGLSKKMFTLLKSMFSNSTYAVRLDSASSTDFVSSTSGIFQGCILSPLLFIFFLESVISTFLRLLAYHPT